MIKAVFKSGLRVIGITDFNIKELQKGRPIRIRLEDLKLPAHDLIIMHGKTELDIQKEIGDAINMRTTVIDESSACEALIKRLADDEGFLLNQINKFPGPIQVTVSALLQQATQLLVGFKAQSGGSNN